METIVGIFLILHGLVHFLYAGQSIRLFELQTGMIWPDASWALSGSLKIEKIRTFAGILCLLAGLVFIVSALGMFVDSPWWVSLTIAGTILSVMVYLLMWNGRMQRLDNQGGIGVLIDLLIVGVIFF